MHEQWFVPWLVTVVLFALFTPSATSITPNASAKNAPVSPQLFAELEEASRLVAIAYCVGNQGIEKPFACPGWCEAFEEFEVVETWDLGFIDSASCGYVALAHAHPQRIVVAFRGSNSLSDAVYDLLTRPAEYAPFPSHEDDNDDDGDGDDSKGCEGCKVHAGFMHLWNATRGHLNPMLSSLRAQYPHYELVVLGHSLGGALAGLAALEFAAKGWKPVVTTFGEPRFANDALAAYVDRVFDADTDVDTGAHTRVKQRYRRVTHVGDPVPLLPSEDWGWRMHAGEIFIAKDSLPAQLQAVRHCHGPDDPSCIRGQSKEESTPGGFLGIPGLPAEWRLWEILFAHRQYFWRIGLCWDPQNYEYPDPPERSSASDEL